MQYTRSTTFTVTEDHLKLARQMNISYDAYAEYGAPCVDPKRPYGNSNVEGDIAEILGWELFEDADGDRHLSAEQRDAAERMHREMETVLQILVRQLAIEPGEYRRPNDYGSDWARAVSPAATTHAG